MFRAHVLIIRRSKLHYTASGIITPVGVIPRRLNFIFRRRGITQKKAYNIYTYLCNTMFMYLCLCANSPNGEVRDVNRRNNACC